MNMAMRDELDTSPLPGDADTWDVVSSSASPDGSANVRVVSLNVLADSLCCARLLPRSPRASLPWAARWPVLSRAMLSSAPDLLFLQEVDRLEDVAPRLLTAGLSHATAQRPTRPDALVTAWSTERFTLVETVVVNFDDLAAPGETRLLRHNVGLIVVLRDVDTQRVLVAANTHLCVVAPPPLLLLLRPPSLSRSRFVTTDTGTLEKTTLSSCRRTCSSNAQLMLLRATRKLQ